MTLNVNNPPLDTPVYSDVVTATVATGSERENHKRTWTFVIVTKCNCVVTELCQNVAVFNLSRVQPFWVGQGKIPYSKIWK